MTTVLAHRPACFVGEGDLFVDRLISASLASKVVPKPHLCFRELQPFFDNFVELPTQPRPSTGGPKHTSGPKKDANQRKTRKSRSQSPQAGKNSQTKGSWAGPGYVVSPMPDALPMPPVSLLRRA